MSQGSDAAGGLAAEAAPSAALNAKRWWSLVALCLAAAIVWFAAANIPVATSAISQDIGGSVTTLQWVNTAFTLTCGALVIAAGRLGDIFGRRRVLDIGLVVFAVASVVAALALGEPLEEALLWGPINAMSVVQEIGAQKGLLTREAIETYLKNTPAQYHVESIL